MATFNVFLGNKVSWMSINWMNIEDATWYYFNKSVASKSGDRYDQVRVQTVTAAPALLPEDLLIYILHNRDGSLIKQKFHKQTKSENAAGFTFWDDNLFCCEVYLRSEFLNDPFWLGKLIWHESMHAKSRLGNSMHAWGNLAGETIQQSTKMSDANIESMRKRLANQCPMWTGGFEL